MAYQTVISDNGPQFSSDDFAVFSRDYQFQHKTSSPKYPQSNGEVERAVQTAKNILKKSSDPYLGLLSYRTTPTKHGYSPSQLMMGRQLRSSLPVHTSKLIPDWPDLQKVRQKDKELKRKQSENFDSRHRARPLSTLTKGEKVWIKAKQITGTVIAQAGTPRSYIIKTRYGNLRRNRKQLNSLKEANTLDNGDPVTFPDTATSTPEVIPDTATNTSEVIPAPPRVEDDQPRTRSGRVIKHKNCLTCADCC